MSPNQSVLDALDQIRGTAEDQGGAQSVLGALSEIRGKRPADELGISVPPLVPPSQGTVPGARQPASTGWEEVNEKPADMSDEQWQTLQAGAAYSGTKVYRTPSGHYQEGGRPNIGSQILSQVLTPAMQTWDIIPGLGSHLHAPDEAARMRELTPDLSPIVRSILGTGGNILGFVTGPAGFATARAANGMRTLAGMAAENAGLYRSLAPLTGRVLETGERFLMGPSSVLTKAIVGRVGMGASRVISNMIGAAGDGAVYSLLHNAVNNWDDIMTGLHEHPWSTLQSLETDAINEGKSWGLFAGALRGGVEAVGSAAFALGTSMRLGAVTKEGLKAAMEGQARSEAEMASSTTSLPEHALEPTSIAEPKARVTVPASAFNRDALDEGRLEIRYQNLSAADRTQMVQAGINAGIFPPEALTGQQGRAGVHWQGLSDEQKRAALSWVFSGQAPGIQKVGPTTVSITPRSRSAILQPAIEREVLPEVPRDAVSVSPTGNIEVDLSKLSDEQVGEVVAATSRAAMPQQGPKPGGVMAARAQEMANAGWHAAKEFFTKGEEGFVRVPGLGRHQLGEISEEGGLQARWIMTQDGKIHMHTPDLWHTDIAQDAGITDQAQIKAVGNIFNGKVETGQMNHARSASEDAGMRQAVAQKWLELRDQIENFHRSETGSVAIDLITGNLFPRMNATKIRASEAMANVGAHGAAKLANGITDYSTWADSMRQDYPGTEIDEHLPAIYKYAKNWLKQDSEKTIGGHPTLQRLAELMAKGWDMRYWYDKWAQEGPALIGNMSDFETFTKALVATSSGADAGSMKGGGNVAQALKLYWQLKLGEPVTGYRRPGPVQAAVNWILGKEELAGPKYQDYAKNLLGKSSAPVIDAQFMELSNYKKHVDKKGVTLQGAPTEEEYDFNQQRVLELAKQLNVAPEIILSELAIPEEQKARIVADVRERPVTGAQAQAAIWSGFKGEKGQDPAGYERMKNDPRVLARLHVMQQIDNPAVVHPDWRVPPQWASPDAIEKSLRDEQYAILSWSDGGRKEITPPTPWKGESMDGLLLRRLTDSGFDRPGQILPVRGVWTDESGVQHRSLSYLVRGMTAAEARRWGEEGAQTSVMTPEGELFTKTGLVKPFSGQVLFNQDAINYGSFSVLNTERGAIPFSMVIDHEPGREMLHPSFAVDGATSKEALANTVKTVLAKINDEAGYVRMGGEPEQPKADKIQLVWNPNSGAYDVAGGAPSDVALQLAAAATRNQRKAMGLPESPIQEAQRAMYGGPGGHTPDSIAARAPKPGTITEEHKTLLASLLGTDKDTLLLNVPGMEDNKAVAAALGVIRASASDLARVARDFRANPGDKEALATFTQEVRRHATLMTTLSGAGNDGSIAMQNVRRMMATGNFSPEDYEEGPRMPAYDPRYLAKVLSDPRVDTARAMAKLFEVPWYGKVVNVINAFRIMQPLTYLKKFVGDLMGAVQRPIDQIAAAGVDAARAGLGLGGGSRERYLGEAGDIFGTTAAWQNSFAKFALAMKGVVDHSTIKGEAAPQIGNGTWDLPFRPLSATTEFWRNYHYERSIWNTAYRYAMKDADHGVFGETPDPQEVQNRIAELAANPTEEMMREANDRAGEYTYTRTLGKFGRDVARLRDLAPYSIGRILFPFTTVPINLAKFAWERSPLGIISTLSSMNKTGDWGEFSDRLGKAMIGSIEMGGMYLMATQGMFTGAGPSDPREKATLQATGWQPFSIRIGNAYVSYNPLHPMGQALAAVATLHEDATSQRPNAVKDLIKQTTDIVGQSFFITDIGNLVGAMLDPQSRNAGYIAGLEVSGLIPRISADIAANMDPYRRDMSTVGRRIMGQIPGLRQTLPPALDPTTGQPIPQAVGTGWAPAISWARDNQVAAEAARLGVPISKPSRLQTTYDSQGNAKRTEMPEADYRRIEEQHGDMVQKVIGRLIASSTYQGLSDDQRREFLQRWLRSLGENR